MREPYEPEFDSSRWFASIRPPYGPEDDKMLHALEELFDTTQAKVGRDRSGVLDGAFDIAHETEPLAGVEVDVAGDTIRVEGLGTIQWLSTSTYPTYEHCVAAVITAVSLLMAGTWTIETVQLGDRLLSRTYTRGSERHRTVYSNLGWLPLPSRWTRRSTVTAQWR